MKKIENKHFYFMRFIDKSTNAFIALPIKRALFSKKSKFQQIEIIELEYFGKCLLLDEELQLAAVDEKIYHSSLVDPVMKARSDLKNVLILGGGDGGAARELLKYKRVRSITIVDIDEEVVRAVEKYLSEVHRGSLFNPKVKIVFQDAFEFIENVNDKFDLIIGDLPDFTKGKHQVNVLYRVNTFKKLKKILNPNGVLLYQAGALPFWMDRELNRIKRAFSTFFTFVTTYAVYIPSFAGIWPFVAGSNKKIRIEYDGKLLKW